MTPLRIAVLGCGHLGRIHTRLLKANPDVQFMGVVDPVPASRTALATEFNVTPYADYREILPHIDAAVVATPTRFHHQVTLDLLHHGIHALVEKPITVTVDEADELIAAAHKNDLVLQVGHVERFNPSFIAVQKQLAPPRYIEAVRASGYTFRSTDVGVVLDLMIHDLDLVLSLAQSPVVDVEALGVAVLGPHEDMAHARLKFANGCIANLKASRTSFQMQRSMHVFTDSGFASIDFATGSAKVVRPDARLLSRTLDVHQLAPEQKTQVKEHLFQDLLRLEDVAVEKGNAIQSEHQDFITSIRTNSQPQVSGEHGRNALAVAQEILEKIAAYHEQDKARILRVPSRTSAFSEQRKAG